MPNWSDDEGRCHFEVNGVPCYQSPVGCPIHVGAPAKSKRPTQGERDAYRRGAEAMRDAAILASRENVGCRHMVCHACPSPAATLRALPIPEDKP